MLNPAPDKGFMEGVYSNSWCVFVLILSLMKLQPLLILPFLFVLSCSIFAQNPFPQGVDFYHWGEDGEVFGVKDGEPITAGDTLFSNPLHYRSQLPWDEEICVEEVNVCFENTEPTVIGVHAFALDSASWSFVNQNGDTVNFVFSQGVGMPTQIYADENSFFTLIYGGFEATSFLGNDDFVPLYSIVEQDAETQAGLGEYEWIVRVGEETGLHTFIDITEFPENVNQISVAGASVFAEGFKPMLWSDAYDFQPGDVCQIQSETNSWGGSFISYRTDSIMNRTDFEDHVEYAVHQTQFSAWLDETIPEWVWTSEESEVVKTYFHEPIIHDAPGRLLDESYGTNQWEEFNSIERWGLNTYFRTLNECEPGIWCHEEYEWIFQNHHYIRGLGMVDSHSGALEGSTQTGLIYYNKGGETYGEQFYLGTESLEAIPLEVFPNPAHTNLSITLPTTSACQLRIMSLNGQSIRSGVYSGQTSIMLDVSDLPQGVYIVEIQDKDSFNQQKLIVQR